MVTRCDWCGWAYEDQRDETRDCLLSGPYGFGCSMYEQVESDEPITCPRIAEAAESLGVAYAR